MKWSETEASRCPYGDIAERVFRGADIICESCESVEHSYEGHAEVLAAFPDGSFVHYTWDWGSCPLCDAWEVRELDEYEIEEEMRRELAVLKNRKALINYLRRTVPYFKKEATKWLEKHPDNRN